MASEIIAVRLHPDNDNERRALEVLASWEQAGYSRRQIVTAALLALGAGPQRTTQFDATALQQLEELRELIRGLYERLGEPSAREPISRTMDELTPTFVESVKRAARPPMTLSE